MEERKKRSNFTLSDSIFAVLGLGFILMVAICTRAFHLKNLVMQNCGLLVGIAAYIYAMAVTTYLAFRREIPRTRISNNIRGMVIPTLLYAFTLFHYSWGNFFVINRKEVGIGTAICLVWLYFLSKKKTKEKFAAE